MFLVLLVLLSCSGSALAQTLTASPGYRPPAHPYLSYFSLKGGAFFPEGDFKQADSGFDGELAYRVQFNRWVALEFGSGYFEMRDTGRVSFGSNVSLKGDIYAIPLTITLKAILPLGPLDVYGLAGGGGYYVHAKGTVSTSSGRTSGSVDAGLAGGFLGGGVAYNFTRWLFVGLEAKYLWTSNASLEIHGERAATDLSIEGVQGTVNLGFRF